jgi:hypothetical protein
VIHDTIRHTAYFIKKKDKRRRLSSLSRPVRPSPLPVKLSCMHAPRHHVPKGVTRPRRPPSVRPPVTERSSRAVRYGTTPARVPAAACAKFPAGRVLGISLLTHASSLTPTTTLLCRRPRCFFSLSRRTRPSSKPPPAGHGCARSSPVVHRRGGGAPFPRRRRRRLREPQRRRYSAPSSCVFLCPGRRAAVC